MNLGALTCWGSFTHLSAAGTGYWLGGLSFSPRRFSHGIPPRGLGRASSLHSGRVQRTSVLRKSQEEAVAPFMTSPKKSFMSLLLHCFSEAGDSGKEDREVLTPAFYRRGIGGLGDVSRSTTDASRHRERPQGLRPVSLPPLACGPLLCPGLLGKATSDLTQADRAGGGREAAAQ